MLSHIARITGARGTVVQDRPVEHLLTDSRRLYSPSSTLFFALPGPRRDGQAFISELYQRGVRGFVVSHEVDTARFPEASFLQVPDVLQALQTVAAWHRQQFHIPVIGITGSNGKTIVKEWLYQLLQPDYQIVRSPKSYNSQIGVPLSVWQLGPQHTLAIFEAGISRTGEMEKLAAIIRPTIGVLTNIGEAHSEGFSDKVQKESEKRKLFEGAQVVPPLTRVDVVKTPVGAVITAFREQENLNPVSIEIPFSDEASIQNALTCWSVLCVLNVPQDVIAARMKQLHSVNMRLEMKKGINHCTVINDSYSVDITSLQLALNVLDQQGAGARKTVILSDFLQSALPDAELYARVLDSLRKHDIQRLIGIGERISTQLRALVSNGSNGIQVECFPGTEDFLEQFRSSQFRDEVILVKGARVFAFEKIVQRLELKAHQTVLEIDLGALVHNLKAYQQRLRPETKVMAMVKAFAYGSGGAEVAAKLQFSGVDYLGVAYADEGVELRKAGIGTPVMVMNPEETAFEKIVEFQLEPELYSFEILRSFESFLRREGIEEYPVHIEVETGMNRLGFSATDTHLLAGALQHSGLRIRTVFSHLAASEDPAEDAFTRAQFNTFLAFCDQLAQQTGQTFLRHIANTAAVLRHPDLQLDMVRLGIGLYGIDPAATGIVPLQPVATLRSTIAQLKQVPAGGSIGYNRSGRVGRDSRIATIRLGYADGYPRRLGNGTGQVWIRGRKVPVIGNVCMDMFMADVTDLPDVTVGDEVILFGPSLPVQDLATAAGTIPYEIMTGISQRVRRVFFEES